jgi:hypothetical protein
VVFRLLLTTAVTVETTGLLLAISVSRGIQKGLTGIIGAANAFSNGDLGARAKVLSRDEIRGGWLRRDSVSPSISGTSAG